MMGSFFLRGNVPGYAPKLEEAQDFLGSCGLELRGAQVGTVPYSTAHPREKILHFWGVKRGEPVAARQSGAHRRRR
jgi:hypothetical protein